MTVISGAWLSADGTQAVLGMLEKAGHEAYAVGGCVRNALMGMPVADVDISTSARPKEVIRLAELSGLKAVPTGIDHGTVTVVANGTGYEVTTFRADVETDGRRAVVTFADDIMQDAIRRDFTMNALYVNRFGQILDPLGGLPDVHARRLRFIEDADRRIREDYLRILRFFRFFAWYCDSEGGVDAEALAAIAANLDGLDQLSRERVGHELVKLFDAQDPLAACSVMARCGVLGRVLPGASETHLGPLLVHESTLDLRPNALRRMAGIGFFDGAALRLSKSGQRRLTLYQSLIGEMTSLPEIAYRHGGDVARDVMALRAALLEQSLPITQLRCIEVASHAVFPVRAKDLPELHGPEIGQALRAMEAAWIASEFSLTREDLLTRRESSRRNT